MTELVWQEPPPPAKSDQRRGRWKVVVEALKERPGEWALLGEERITVVQNLQRGIIGGCAKGEVEVVGRNRRTRDSKVVVDVYARYVGNGSNGAA